jgi:hypothetical protein
MINAHCRPGIWQETIKNVEMRNTNCRTLNIVRNPEKSGK